MTRTRRLAAVAVTAAFALSLAACSDDESSGGGSASSEEQPYVDAAAASLAADEEMPLDEGETECVATLMVTTVGVDRFEEAGVEPADLEDPEFDISDAGVELTEEDADAIASGLGDCVDITELFAQSMAADEELSDEDADCLRENLDEEQLTALLASELAGEEEPDEEMMTWVFELMAACPGLAGDMSGE